MPKQFIIQEDDLERINETHRFLQELYASQEVSNNIARAAHSHERLLAIAVEGIEEIS